MKYGQDLFSSALTRRPLREFPPCRNFLSPVYLFLCTVPLSLFLIVISFQCVSPLLILSLSCFFSLLFLLYLSPFFISFSCFFSYLTLFLYFPPFSLLYICLSFHFIFMLFLLFNSSSLFPSFLSSKSISVFIIFSYYLRFSLIFLIPLSYSLLFT